MPFSGKIAFHVAARLLRFATIRDCSPLFALFARLFALFVLFAIRDYSLFAIRDYSLFAIRYSGFPDTRSIFTLSKAFDCAFWTVLDHGMQNLKVKYKSFNKEIIKCVQKSIPYSAVNSIFTAFLQLFCVTLPTVWAAFPLFFSFVWLDSIIWQQAKIISYLQQTVFFSTQF